MQGGYQTGDLVKIRWMPGRTEALDIKGKTFQGDLIPFLVRVAAAELCAQKIALQIAEPLSAIHRHSNDSPACCCRTLLSIAMPKELSRLIAEYASAGSPKIAARGCVVPHAGLHVFRARCRGCLCVARDSFAHAFCWGHGIFRAAKRWRFCRREAGELRLAMRGLMRSWPGN